jgi:hypothetical protein
MCWTVRSDNEPRSKPPMIGIFSDQFLARSQGLLSNHSQK